MSQAEAFHVLLEAFKEIERLGRNAIIPLERYVIKVDGIVVEALAKVRT